MLLALAVADCAARSPRSPRGALMDWPSRSSWCRGIIVYLWLSGRRRATVTAAVAALAWTLGAWLLLPATRSPTGRARSSSPGGSGPTRHLQPVAARHAAPGVLPGQAPGALWAAVAVVAAVAGFAVARRLALRRREMEGIACRAARRAALAGLLDPSLHRRGGGHRRDPGGRPVPPADRHRGRDRGVLRADHPLVGPALLRPNVPALAARVVEDKFGIAAVALVVILARLGPRGGPARTGSDVA